MQGVRRPADAQRGRQAHDVGTERDGIHCGPCLAAKLARERRDEDLAKGTDSFEEYEA